MLDNLRDVRAFVTAFGSVVRQPEEAIAELSRALALPEAGKEDMYWMLTQRSRLYMSQNDAISAADDAADCIKINQRVVEGYERHCDALVGIGDLDAARACAQVSLAPCQRLRHLQPSLSSPSVCAWSLLSPWYPVLRLVHTRL
jgi:hypothetical protein